MKLNSYTGLSSSIQIIYDSIITFFAILKYYALVPSVYFNLVQIQYIILVETSNSNIAAVHRSRALMVAQRCLISRQIGTLCGPGVCAESRCRSCLGYADQSILETMDHRSWNIEDGIVKFKFRYDVAESFWRRKWSKPSNGFGQWNTISLLWRCTLEENTGKKNIMCPRL